MSQGQVLRQRGTFSGTLCYRHSAPRLGKSSNPGSFLPYLHNWSHTVAAEKLSSGLLFTPPGGDQAEAENATNVLAWSDSGSAESVEPLHFDWVVFFELLEGDPVGVRCWARVADKLGEGTFVRHHNIIIINSCLHQISINLQHKQWLIINAKHSCSSSWFDPDQSSMPSWTANLRQLFLIELGVFPRLWPIFPPEWCFFRVSWWYSSHCSS